MNAIERALEAIQSLPRGASFNRGKSKQDYRTPDDFRKAVKKWFGMPQFDLAASATNFFAPSDSEYFGVGSNSLEQNWQELSGILWLNPPFDDISPWAKKCAESSDGSGREKILFLTPASVGSNWFRDYVHGKAKVFALNGRLSFDGVAPYPKDCMLSVFGMDPGFDVWSWKEKM